MSSAATVFSQENTRFIEGFMQTQLIDLQSEVRDGVELMLLNEREIVGQQFDERRKLVTRLTKVNGDIIAMPANGIPSGNTKYSDGDSYEEDIDLTEKVGEFYLAERNATKLNAMLSTLNLATDGEIGMKMMEDMGWGTIIRDNMYRDLINAEKTALLAILNALKSTQIYGIDYVVANSGTLLGGDNLAVETFGPDIQDVILTQARDMETLKGYKVGFSVPKYFFTTAANLPDAYRIFSPGQTVNDLQNNLFDYFTGAPRTFVDAPSLTGDFSLAIGGNHGIKIYYETPEPRFLMNTDEYGNITMLLKRVSGFGVVARQGIVQIDHP